MYISQTKTTYGTKPHMPCDHANHQKLLVSSSFFEIVMELFIKDGTVGWWLVQKLAMKSLTQRENYLDYRHLTTKHKHNAHLQDDSESVPNVISTKFLKALSTITTLQQESIPKSSFAQFLFKIPSFPSKYNWGIRRKGLENWFQLYLIRVFRELRSRLRFPAFETPFSFWVLSSFCCCWGWRLNGWDGFDSWFDFGVWRDCYFGKGRRRWVSVTVQALGLEGTNWGGLSHPCCRRRWLLSEPFLGWD